jgi:hypothetical protein
MTAGPGKTGTVLSWEEGGPRGTRTHNERIKRIPVPGDQGLYQYLREQRQPSRPHHGAPVDVVSHHDPHHDAACERLELPEVPMACVGKARYTSP